MPYYQQNNFDPNANLIIKNLESFLNESHIIQKFKEFGDILSCKLVRDLNGESKCYAYLQFKGKSSALQAIDSLNNTYWDEMYDPDFHYKKYREKIYLLKDNQLNSFVNDSVFDDKKYFNDFNQSSSSNSHSNKATHGKKIYVGLFKKKDEYSRMKQEKEGKPSNLYVKNFGQSFGDRDFFILFKSFGSIKSAKVRRQKFGIIEKPLGCGFVDYECPEQFEDNNCLYTPNTNNNYQTIYLNDYNDENRYRSVSTSSESSFDSILVDWSEMWNRKIYSEYKLFY